jgi:hypothetical protein
MLQGITDKLSDIHKEILVGRAESRNVWIRMNNRSYMVARPTPLRKEVCKLLRSGQALCLNLDHDIRVVFDLFAANEPPAEIGAPPSFFNGSIDALEHLDILKLIYFYNDTMGVEARHDLAERKVAVYNFLTSL